MQINLFGAVWLATLWLSGGCSKDPIHQEARRIVELSTEQRRAALRALPPEKQLDIDMDAATRFEPPFILAYDIAHNWRSILPLLPSRMTSEADDNKLLEYTNILFAVAIEHCSLANQRNIVAVAEQTVTRIQPPLRAVAEKLLSEITHPTKTLQPCE